MPESEEHNSEKNRAIDRVADYLRCSSALGRHLGQPQQSGPKRRSATLSDRRWVDKRTAQQLPEVDWLPLCEGTDALLPHVCTRGAMRTRKFKICSTHPH
jgi:hypothetical protein